MENSGTACRDLPQGHSAFGSVATASEARLRPLPFNQAALDGAGSVLLTRKIYTVGSRGGRQPQLA